MFSHSVTKALRGAAALVAAGALTLSVAACGSGPTSSDASTSDVTQQTVNPGTLTIATGNPAYEPWVMNNKPETGEGFEAAIAYKVAEKLGFAKKNVKWTRTSFDAAIAPGAKDWDLNIQQFSVTPERKKAVDFSTSYYNDTTSVVVKKNSKYATATSLADLKNATVGAMVGTPAYTQVKKHINQNVQTFNDDAALAQALDAGQIDALATSTVESVYIVDSNQVKSAKVLGRIAGSEEPDGLGIVLPKDSKLTKKVSAALDSMRKDGSLKKLQDKWLAQYTTDVTELK
ncbi:MAG: ABC transporter substrate-binding protein [Bifidobacteriaceae bacterium]|jgi:polar amino acid transport system substrate-binding protein|nr:ABC transporter substrate-binding protein [Bifidobacteriaceae bacterium]MCI1914533.1 ABC transporter substrate-binding protein [Bifidobacteriaceae bacterium]